MHPSFSFICNCKLQLGSQSKERQKVKMSSDTLTVEALNEFKNRKESGTVLDKKLDLWKNLDRRVKDYHDDARSFLFGSCMTV